MKNIVWLAFLLVIVSCPAWAALGQYEGSISLDKQALKSEDQVRAFPAYKVHQLTTTHGVTVREYVSAQGLVFGVSWGGRFMPDLHQLLGNYVNNVQSASASETHIRHLRGITIKTSDFVFTNFGHMQSWAGSAYVPSMIPANVTAEVVR